MTSAEKILKDALSLPEDERRLLGKRLLESVPGPDPAHQEAWVDEAKRRADAIERGEGELLNLDEALGQLRSDLRDTREA